MIIIIIVICDNYAYLTHVAVQSGDPAVLDRLIEENRTGTTAAAAAGTSDDEEEDEQQEQQERRGGKRRQQEGEEEEGLDAGLGPGSQAKQQKRKGGLRGVVVMLVLSYLMLCHSKGTIGFRCWLSAGFRV